MKSFAPVVSVFAILVAGIVCQAIKNDRDTPNEEITEVLKRILKRLDMIEDNVKEVRQQSLVEQQEIATNSKSVKELSDLVKVNLGNITKDIGDVKEILTEVLPGKTKRRPAESCSWVEQHSYCVRSGNFWIKDGGKASLKFCKIDDGKPVPTTAQPTKQPSTVRPTTAVTTPEPVYHGVSCKDLNSRYPHLKSGTYNITVGGSTFGAYCDMDTDEGGWTMVGRAVVNEDSEAKEVHYKKIQRDDYTELHKVSSGRFLLSTIGLNSLYNVQKFNEIRFDCHKPYHGRRVNLKTKGSDVVQWLLQRRSKEPKPPSCSTFTSLHGDTSYVGSHCQNWDKRVWCSNKIYYLPIWAHDSRNVHYDVSLDHDNFRGVLCDDWRLYPNRKDVGYWTYYVR